MVFIGMDFYIFWRKPTLIVCAFCALSFFFSAFQADKAYAVELITPYSGSGNVRIDVFDYISTELPIGPIEKYSRNSNLADVENILTVEGKGTFTWYKLGKQTSQFEFIKALTKNVKEAGFDVLLSCETKIDPAVNTCGEDLWYFVNERTTARYGISTCGNSEKSFFLTAKIQRADKKNTYLFVCNEKNKVYQAVIEERDFDFNKVSVNLADYKFDAGELKQSGPQKADEKGSKDHPLVSRFEGAYIRKYRQLSFVSADLPAGKISYVEKRENLPLVKAEGKASFTHYITGEHVSQLEVGKNYLNAFKAKGAEILFYCEDETTCGDGFNDFSPYNHSTQADHASNTGNCRDSDAGGLTAKLVQDDRNIFFFYCFNAWNDKTEIFQTVIEEKSANLELVSLTSEQIQKEIALKGKAAIYGILFDYESATVKNESKDIINQIAEFLKKNTAVNLYVVGHTDNSGSEEYNRNLSLKRAESVVNILVKEHAIAHNRLHARGVGMLVPIASNKAEDGRQLNRRVELVEF